MRGEKRWYILFISLYTISTIWAALSTYYDSGTVGEDGSVSHSARSGSATSRHRGYNYGK
jgi:hypothetical protein